MSDLIIKYGKNEVSIANKEDLFSKEAEILDKRARAYLVTSSDTYIGIANLFDVVVDASLIGLSKSVMVWQQSPGLLLYAVISKCYESFIAAPDISKAAIKNASSPFQLLTLDASWNDKKAEDLRSICASPVIKAHPLIGAALISFFCSQFDILGGIYSNVLGHTLAAAFLKKNGLPPIYAYIPVGWSTYFDKPTCYFLDDWISDYLKIAEEIIVSNGVR